MLSSENYQSLFHEIKNIISVIGGSLQLIEKQHPEVREFSYWEDTKDDISALQALIRDASQDGLCQNVKKQPVNLHDFLSDLHLLAQALLADDSSINFEIAPDLSFGYFDPIRIRQAMLNLIKNAVEAMKDHPQLTVRAYNKKTSLFFEVTDNGAGISDEARELLFQPFYTNKTNGSGLGLPITKGIVESHGGTITVQSTFGCGSTFTIELPNQPTQTERADPAFEES